MEGPEILGLPPLELNRVPAARREAVTALVQRAQDAGRLRIRVDRALGRQDDPSAVWCVSSVDGHLGPTRFDCVNDFGEVTDLDQAWSRYASDRYARDGAMTLHLADEVRQRLAAGAPQSDAMLRVLAWARQPAELTEIGRDPETPAQAVLALWAEAVVALADECRAAADRADSTCEVEPIPDAPMVALRTTAAVLNDLSRQATVGVIEHYAPDTETLVPQANGNHFLHSGRFHVAQGYSPPVAGNGVAIGVLEGTQPRPGSVGAFAGWLDGANDIYCTSGISGFHSEAVASVIASDPNFGTLNGGPRWLDGAAPGARLILANMGNFFPGFGHCTAGSVDPTCNPTCSLANTYVAATNWALGRGAQVLLNANAFSGQTLPGQYHWLDRYTDWRVNTPSVAPHSHFPTVVTVGGQSLCQSGPGQAMNGCYNCLVVGGSNDQDDETRSNDVHGQMCDKNLNTDLEVPHVDAIGSQVRAMGGFSDNLVTEGRWGSAAGVSTSWASPQVAGLAALAIAERPALSQYPEAVRAVLMATATKDTDGNPLVLGDTLDDKDGAGLINAGVAARLLRTGAVNVRNTSSTAANGVNYDVFNQSHFFSGTGYYNRWVGFAVPYQFGTLRAQVTLTWNVQVTCSGSTLADCPAVDEPTSAGRYAIDIYNNLSNPPIAVSSVVQNHHNYVHVRFPVASGNAYYVLIKREWLNPSPVGPNYFGLAWTTFNTAEQ